MKRIELFQKYNHPGLHELPCLYRIDIHTCRNGLAKIIGRVPMDGSVPSRLIDIDQCSYPPSHKIIYRDSYHRILWKIIAQCCHRVEWIRVVLVQSLYVRDKVAMNRQYCCFYDTRVLTHVPGMVHRCQTIVVGLVQYIVRINVRCIDHIKGLEFNEFWSE